MSDELIIDLSNYKDRVGSRVAPGKYRVVVDDAESAESANKNPMVNLWFRIKGGEFDDQMITDRLVLTDKSLFRVVGFMQAIGLPTPKKKLKLNIRQFVGRTLDIEVDDGDPYNGRVRSEVRGYNKIVGAAKSEQADDLEGLGEFKEEQDTDASATDLPDVNLSDEAGDSAASSNDDDDDVDLDTINL